MSTRNVKYDSSAKPSKKEPSTPLLRKVWYAVTAILFFVLVLVALISGSYILFFLNQNPTCANPNNKSQKVKNSAIASVTVAVVCLILVIGFAALQVRNQRRGKRKEKEEAEKERQQEEEDEEEEEEEEERRKKKKKKIRSESELEEGHVTLESEPISLHGSPVIEEIDPKKMQQILQDLPIPHSQLP